jgi:cell division transport system ATP-binding protein
VPSAGEITFEDTRLSDISRSKIHLHRRKIGVVFQDYKLLSELNVWENIALALNIIGKSQEEIETRVTDLLRLVNITEKAFLFPSQLSGGEAQRVSIARALATGPSVIFADEPTGNLDPETSLSIAKLLKKINELGTTVLFATHDVSVLNALPNERHFHLDNGVLVEDSHKGSSKTTKTAHKKDEAPLKEEGTHSTASDAQIEKPRSTKHDSDSHAEDSTTEKIEVKVEDIDQKPKKGFSLSLGWPFGGKKSRKDEVLGGSDKNEDLNHIHEKHDHTKVSVESIEEESTKPKK